MEYLNVHRSTVRGEAMQDAPGHQPRTWLFLATYCCDEENGGRIAGAKGWSDRKWLQMAGLGREDVHQESLLWEWEGEDLVLHFYPVEQELVHRAKRRGGAKGGRQKAANRSATRTGHNPAVLEAEAEGEVVGVPVGVPAGEVLRKGREGKGKKGKERERLPGEGALSGPTRTGQDVSEGEIPTEAEVREWAEVAGVDPEFAAQKHASFSERHGWMANGELIDWRGRLKRFWKEDQAEWEAKQKKRPAANQKNGRLPGEGNEKPAGWKEGDEGWWWSEELELIEKALHGALLGGQEEQAGRLKEILKVRKG